MLSSNLDLRSEIIRANQYLHKQYEDIEKAENSLSEFIKQAWHVIEPSAPYIHGWHIDAIAEHLEAATKGQIIRLLTNVPPGTMKSLINNVFWPAWEWGPKKMPHYRILCASHTMSLSVRDNLKMRRLVSSDWYQERYPHVKLMKDQNAKSKFENSMSGFREAMAMSSLTGSRGNRVQLDDPLSVEDAKSKAALKEAEDILCETIPTRLVDPEKSFIGVVMQRLSENDTSGIILSRDFGYVHLMLPMEFEPKRKCFTSIGFEDPRTEEGELLFPERFPRNVVERDKIPLGVYGVAGQFQQRPAPRGGGVIKIDKFRYYKELPPFSFKIQSWDTAFKTKKENDFSVCTTWGVYNGGFYLIDVYKDKVEFPELKKFMLHLALYHSPHSILIEDKASGQSLIQEMSRVMVDPDDPAKKYKLPIRPIKAEIDKLSRANAATTTLETNVYLPENAPWLQGFLDELSTFPAAAHDDQVDSAVQGVLFLANINRPTVSRSNYFNR